MPLLFLGKAAPCLRVAVRIGEVGLDVQNGGAVHHVCPGNHEHRALVRGDTNLLKGYACQPDGIRPVRGSSGEDPHAGIAPKPWWTHRGGPGIPLRLMKGPHQPQVAEAFQPPKGFRCPVFRLEDDYGLQILRQSALPGQAELGGEVIAHVGDDLHGEGIHQASSCHMAAMDLARKAMFSSLASVSCRV